MRVLFLSQGKTVDTHPGFQDALCKLKKEGFVEDFLNIPYFGYAEEHGWESFYRHVIDLCQETPFDVVHFHFFHRKGKPSPRGCMEAIKAIPYRPIVVTSVGDGFSAGWMLPDYPNDFKEASRCADITFATQMGKAAEKMMRWGARNIVLSPLSMCQKRFRGEGIDLAKHRFDFDVVWVGSRNTGRIFNPFNRNSYAARERNQLVELLAKRYGPKFGLFGKGWDHLACAQGPVPFDQQQTAFRRGRIVVGGTPYSLAEYYASDRPFFSISSGIPTIEMRVPRLGQILRDGEHVYFVDSVEGILDKCEALLSIDPQKLYQKASVAAHYIAERHTQYNRLKFELTTAYRYRANGNKLDVEFPFFLPEIDVSAEKLHAIRGAR
jgi:hypothetical protein